MDRRIGSVIVVFMLVTNVCPMRRPGTYFELTDTREVTGHVYMLGGHQEGSREVPVSIVV